MKSLAQELEKIAGELRKANEKMAVDVREGAKKSQEGMDLVLNAVNKMKNQLFTLPDTLMRIAKELKEK